MDSIGASNDTGYLRCTLEVLYADEKFKLPYRCLRGISAGIIERNNKKYYRERKEAISPEKRLVVQKLFERRLKGLSISLPKEEVKKRLEAKYI